MKRGRPQVRTPIGQDCPAGRRVPDHEALPGDRQIQPAAQPFSQIQLGRDLRTARKNAGLTLVQLAGASGYSITHLSQVERGQACPTMGALRRISDSLGVDIRVFLEPGSGSESPMVRRSERPRMELAPPHLVAEYLVAPIAGGALFAALLRIAPFGSDELPSPVLTVGARCIYVLKGRLELTFEGVTRYFETGDAYYATAGVERHYRNIDPEPCELLVISLAPVA
jgi:transcriptional regulator with XRE-family HTH domain